MVLFFFLPPAVLPDFVVGLAFFVTLVDVFANAEPVLALGVVALVLAGAAAGVVAAGAAAGAGVAAAAAGFLVASTFY